MNNLCTDNNTCANVSRLVKLLSPCRICPLHCGVNRPANEIGKCGAGANILLSSYNLHFSEEPPISGTKGSGTIFFTGCSLSCVFCQNYPISQFGHGNSVSVEKISDMMLELQNRGAHNINFVTPTHYAVHMAKAIIIAKKNGLNIPILYNSSGYDDPETLKLLDGMVDIYMPDSKYSDDVNAKKYSGVNNYMAVNRAAMKEMFRQVGNLKFNKHGIAQRGLIIRHLVLPHGIAGTKEVLKFIVENISVKVHLSLMSQYHPANKAFKYLKLSKKLTKKEYGEVLEYANMLGFENGWIQEL